MIAVSARLTASLTHCHRATATNPTGPMAPKLQKMGHKAVTLIVTELQALEQ